MVPQLFKQVGVIISEDLLSCEGALKMDPRHRHPPPGMALQRTAWVRLNRVRTGVGRIRSCLYTWGMVSSAACKCSAEEQSTSLSSNVQSIDLLMDRTAWRFWTLRQSNGCSTPVPRSRAAKQWLEQVAQKKKKMHDSAPCHRSKAVKECLTENSLATLDWPGNSPNLNPI